MVKIKKYHGAKKNEIAKFLESSKLKLIEDSSKEQPGMHISRKEWKNLNRFRIGHGRCGYWPEKRGITKIASCEYGEHKPDDTVHY